LRTFDQAAGSDRDDVLGASEFTHGVRGREGALVLGGRHRHPAHRSGPPRGEGRPDDCEVVRFRPPRGKQHIPLADPEGVSDLLAGQLEASPGASSDLMRAGRVPEPVAPR
jgi:hypothetical protein